MTRGFDRISGPQVPTAHYRFHNYETVERYASYWYQVSTILSLQPKSILEIGVGSGVSRYSLARAGIPIVTADIDKQLGSDYEADVRKLPFDDNRFDVVTAFQVLEHLPFSDFVVALRELRRVTGRYVCISLPDAGRYARLSLRLPGALGFDWVLDLSKFRKRHVFQGEHYWEINKRGFQVKVVRRAILDSQLKIVGENRLRENMYHRFFILKK